MAHCDWYQATIPEHPQAVGEALLAKMPGAAGFQAGRGRNNYHHSMLVVGDDGETLATILHGGPNGAPNAWASGDRAEPFASTVRSCWPDTHAVTRFDSAEDVHGHYPTYRDRCRALAAPSGVGGYEIAAHGDEKGSTDYLGSKSSRVQHRLYEKGKQLAALAADPATVPADWLRLEVQWRPPKMARFGAARVSADEVWGVSPWVQAIKREVIGGDVERLRSRPKMLTDDERSWAACMQMFGPMIDRVRQKVGDDALFVARFIADLNHRMGRS